MLRISAAIACTLTVVFATVSRAQSQGPVPNAFAPEISVSGRGEVRQPADRVLVSFSVETRDPSASAAATANSRRMASMSTALQSAGVAKTDIVTAGYSVRQEMQHDPRTGRPQNSGFVASNSVRVEVRKLDEIGRIIDAGLSGGATQVLTSQLGPLDPGDARRRALELAVVEARREAETIARAAGGTLGRLIFLTSSPSNIPMYRGDMMQEVQLSATAGGSVTPFSPREIVIGATAMGRWEFIPGLR